MNGQVYLQLTNDNTELSSAHEVNMEKVKVAEQVVSAETCKLEQNLVEEIVFCTNSLECLVEMCDNPRGLDLADMLATRRELTSHALHPLHNSN